MTLQKKLFTIAMAIAGLTIGALVIIGLLFVVTYSPAAPVAEVFVDEDALRRAAEEKAQRVELLDLLGGKESQIDASDRNTILETLLDNEMNQLEIEEQRSKMLEELHSVEHNTINLEHSTNL